MATAKPATATKATEADVVYAKQPLFWQGVRAHNPGDPVPLENVEANGWQDGVQKSPPTPDDE